MEGILSSTDISTSGLSAERLRMETIANNIANANTTRGPNGEPYRRKEVVFTAVYDDAVALGRGQQTGLKAQVVETDLDQLTQVFDPGHPDADAEGYVTMPSVSLPDEMVDLISANRSYEANLKVLRAFREMAEQALSLLQRI